MKVSFTSNKEVVDAMVSTLNSNGYALGNKVKLLGFNHYDGFSTVMLDLIGEPSDLIFLGIYTASTHKRQLS